MPVLAREALEHLAPPSGGRVVDATIGPGGHAELLLAAVGPGGLLIGIDADDGNLVRARQRLGSAGNVRLFQANFAELDGVLQQAEVRQVDAVLADFGLSSNQIEDPARGFSFSVAGPLDMRIDPRGTTTAGDLVNELGEAELAELLRRHGEERSARRVARAVVRARRSQPITTTVQLAEIVARAAAPRRGRRPRIHPATRCFLALRSAVNDELGAISTFLQKLPPALTCGGRAAVISFHSLEDRLCKRAFRHLQRDHQARVLTPRPVTPSAAEVEANPRSRSAKLRAMERI